MVSRRPPVSQHPLPSLAARVGGGDDTLMPSVAIKSGGIYCRKCGYDLRGQAEMHRCPECGQGFDPADGKTFRTRPPRGAVWWVKVVAIVLLTLGLCLAMCWGWLYWGWRNEQAVVANTRATVWGVEPLGGEKLKGYLGSAGWVLDRVSHGFCPVSTTDTDLASIKQLKGLHQFSLCGTKITDAGLVHLKKMSGLQVLELTNTHITDTGLVHLEGMSGLQVLDLANTHITDTGLVHLKDLKKLRYLELTGTKVTADGVRKLRAALPEATIRIHW